MKFLPLFVLLSFCAALPAYAVQRNLEITWELPHETGITPEGYRLYINGQPNPVCTKTSNVTSMECTLEVSGSSAMFTLTSYSGDIESPHSAPFKYTFLNARFSSNPASGEAPLLVTFDAQPSTGNIASYNWDFGDGSGAKGKRVQHKYTSTGTYTARLTITDDKGGTASQTSRIRVTKTSQSNHAPRALIDVEHGSGKIPLTVQFDASRSSDPDKGDKLSYKWDFGDGSKASGKTTTHTYVTQGVIKATLTVTDNHKASSTAHVPIVVSAPAPPPDQNGPIAVITMNPSSPILVNTPCRMSGAESTPSTPKGSIESYRWDFGDGSTASGKTATHSFANPGVYNVTLTVRDSSGKSKSHSQAAWVIRSKDNQKTLILLQIYRMLLLKKPAAN